MAVKRGTRTSRHELAKRFTKALKQSETAFIEALMEVTGERGFSSMARVSGIDRVVLHRYARGVGRPRFDMLIKLAAAYDLDFSLVPKKRDQNGRRAVANSINKKQRTARAKSR